MVDCVNASSPYFEQLEEKPKPVLSHDFGAGAKCLKCDCRGLDLHFWRKRCKECACRVDDHDVEITNQHDYCNLLRRRLQPGKIQIEEEKFRHIGGNVQDTQNPVNHARTQAKEVDKHSNLDWIPCDDERLAQKYVEALPGDDQPIKGTIGAQNRKKRLQFQLPVYDCYPESATSIQSEAARQELAKFVKKAQNNVAMGQVVNADVPTLAAHGYRGKTVNTATGTVAPCKVCQGAISPASVAVLPSDTKRDSTNAWHAGCFKCEKCNDLLADLLYFNKDGKYFCGRHYCETAFDRCAGCDELILDKQYTNAEDKSWHVHHFCCFGCDKQFINEDYVSKEEQFYCFECYLIKFAKSCAACDSKIGAPEPYVTHKDLHWHKRPSCFRCRTCAKSLEMRFLLKDKHIFCSDQCKRAAERRD